MVTATREGLCVLEALTGRLPLMAMRINSAENVIIYGEIGVVLFAAWPGHRNQKVAAVCDWGMHREWEQLDEGEFAENSRGKGLFGTEELYDSVIADERGSSS